MSGWRVFQVEDGVFRGPGQFDQMMKQALAGEPVRALRGAGCLRDVAEDVLISDCINSCRKRFLRLKSLLDIAETANAWLGLDWDGPAWKTRAFGCHQIVYSAPLVTKLMPGCEVPD